MAITAAQKVHKTWRGTDTVTVEFMQPQGAPPVQMETTALQAPIDREHRLFSGVSLSGDNCVWLVPIDELAGNDVERGDRIVVAGLDDDWNSDTDAWRVVSAALIFFGSVWRCECSKEV